MSRQERLIVVAEAAGERLDLYLANCLAVPRKRIKFALDSGTVFVNNASERRAGRILAAGDAVAVTLARPPAPLAVPEVAILARGDGWLAIDKPAGLVVHPTVANEMNALDLVRARLRADGENAAPILLHRLDRETSGLLLFALDAAANRTLARAFSERTVEKVYLALAAGTASGTWQVANHLRAGVRGKTVAVQSGGLRAETKFAALASAGGMSLIEARPKTGRTHQIRAHLAGCSLPLLGDLLYGGPDRWDAQGDVLPLRRHFLHAHRLVFSDPTGRRIELSSPLPQDFRQLLAVAGIAGF